MADIIRCKDCKYFQSWRSLKSAEKFGQIYECARLILSCPEPDDYCSKAERQEPRDDVVSKQAVNTLVDELARAISDERCYIPQRGRDTATIMQDILDLPPVISEK